MLFKNKRGEKWLSPWLIFIITFIAGGIVIGVGVFINSEIDINAIESDILVEKVVNCLINNGYINEEIFTGNFDIFSECGLSEKLNTKEVFYLKFEVYNLKNCNLDNLGLKCSNALFDSGVIGSASIRTLCDIKGTTKVKKNYPECSEKFVYVLNEKGEQLILHVYAGSNNYGKREMD